MRIVQHVMLGLYTFIIVSWVMGVLAVLSSDTEVAAQWFSFPSGFAVGEALFGFMQVARR